MLLVVFSESVLALLNVLGSARTVLHFLVHSVLWHISLFHQ